MVAAPQAAAAAPPRPINAGVEMTTNSKSHAKKSVKAKTKAKAPAKPKPAPVTCHTAKLKAGANAALTDFDQKQLGYAVTIYNTAKHLGMPQRAAVVAMSTALQESYLRNLANVNVPASMKLPHDGAGQDFDSVGLFQQRPLAPWGNGSWGTPTELMTPQISATKFYKALASVWGWQNMPVTVAAQTVQGSAFPDAYAQHEGAATAMVKAVKSGVIACSDKR